VRSTSLGVLARWPLLCAFSAAALNLLPPLRILIYSSRADRYFVPVVALHDYAAGLAVLAIATAAFHAALRAALRLPARLSHPALAGLLLLALINPLNFLRITLGPRIAFLVVAAIGVGTAWRWWRRRDGLSAIAAALGLAFAMFAPLAAMSSLQLAWRLVPGSEDSAEDSASSPVPAGHFGGAGSGDPLQRVVWVVFDELDGRMLSADRTEGRDLPAFAAFREVSVHLSHVRPVSGDTLTALPSYWIGRRVLESRPVASDRLEVRIENRDDFVPVTEYAHIFEEVRRRGGSTGVAGFYHPYCRLFPAHLERCSDYQPDGIYEDETPSLADSAVADFAAMVPIWRRVNWIRAIQKVVRDGLELAADPALDLVLIHVNAPHDPPVYDPASGRFRYLNLGLHYADNLVLADRTVAQLRSALVGAGRWESCAVVVSSDHGWRRLPGAGSEPGAIPLMIKLPRQQQGVEIAVEMDSVHMRDMLLAILDRRVTDPAGLVAWVTGRTEGSGRGAH
jgi:hypothetical protein